MFMINACKISNYLDDRNYWAYQVISHSLLKAETLDELYVRIAKYRIDNEQEPEWDGDSYYTTDFGNIYEVIKEYSYDETICEQTTLWTSHIKNIADAKAIADQEEKEREAEEHRKRQEQQDQRDIEDYQRLKAKFEKE